MATEIELLRAELAALRGEVRRKRRHTRLLPVVIAALLVALIPGLAIAANPFNDLIPGSVHNTNIDLIYNAGITTGCVPGQQYCPTDFVTRQEMASFLARTAGLGANAPVANAKTLSGLAANGLVRANAGAQGSTSATVAAAYQPVATVTITAPGVGFVYLTGAVTVYAVSSGSAYVSANIVDSAGGFKSYPVSAMVGTAAASTSAATISPTVVFPVNGARAVTYSLLVGRDATSTGTTGATNATLSVLFVPFGPDGAIGSEVTPNDGPPGTPPARP